MFLAYHFTFSAYGFWLPNDPRGGWSDVVRETHLRKFGRARKVSGRTYVAHDAHDRKLRLQAKSALRYKPVRFNGQQALAIVQGFERALEDYPYVFRSIAVLPDHVHVILDRTNKHHDDIAEHLKGRATKRLVKLGIHPLRMHPLKNGSFPSPWSRGHWTEFIEEESHLRNSINYVNNNPVKHGFKRQNWKIITPLE